MYVKSNPKKLWPGLALSGVRRARRGGLGCSSCSGTRLGRRLGQDDVDDALFGAGTFSDSLSTPAVLTPGPGPDASAPYSAINLPAGSFGTGAPSIPLPTSGSGSIIPSVSAATLLAAAQLPNAPQAVTQAAASYRVANPASAALSAPAAGGFPTWALLGGGLLLVVLVSGGKKKR